MSPLALRKATLKNRHWFPAEFCNSAKPLGAEDAWPGFDSESKEICLNRGVGQRCMVRDAVAQWKKTFPLRMANTVEDLIVADSPERHPLVPATSEIFNMVRQRPENWL